MATHLLRSLIGKVLRVFGYTNVVTYGSLEPVDFYQVSPISGHDRRGVANLNPIERRLFDFYQVSPISLTSWPSDALWGRRFGPGYSSGGVMSREDYPELYEVIEQVYDLVRTPDVNPETGHHLLCGYKGDVPYEECLSHYCKIQRSGAP